MEKIYISEDIDSEIYLDGNLELLDFLVDKGNTIVLTDQNIFKNYTKELEGYQTIILEPGEQNKTLDTYQKIIRTLLKKNANRQTTLVGIGGGVISDLCGFVASTFMRGMDFGFVSTTILSQVDASIGGKNGLNFDGIKNIIGTISQPRFVINDYNMLNSLPKTEIQNGFGEIIKHILLDGSISIDKLIESPKSYLEVDEKLKKLITHSIKFKAKIVAQDEKDLGIRNILNFGHTFGHAIEVISKEKHGLAVCIGMVISSKISVKFGLLSNEDLMKIIKLLKSFDLPVETNISKEKLLEKIKNDKKRNGLIINFVLLNGIGNPVFRKLSFSEIEQLL